MCDSNGLISNQRAHATQSIITTSRYEKKICTSINIFYVILRDRLHFVKPMTLFTILHNHDISNYEITDDHLLTLKVTAETESIFSLIS